jgi:nicotinate-nucleotide adenylyltransferase
VDTLEALKRAHRGARLWLLIGADSLRELPTWHAPERIVRLARLAVADRPGAIAPRALPRGLSGRVTWLGNPGFEVSSSAIRQQARAGRSVRYFVAPAVARYIEARRLYARRR